MQSFNLIFNSAFSRTLSIFRLMPFHFLCSAAPTKYQIYVLFTLKIYSDLIEIFSFFFAVPSVAFLLFFHTSPFLEKRRKRKTHKMKMKE